MGWGFLYMDVGSRRECIVNAMVFYEIENRRGLFHPD